MDGNKNNKFVHLVAFFLLAFGIIGILVLNLKKSSVYFFNVREVFSKDFRKKDEKFRVFGEVEEVQKLSKGVEFKLVDKDRPDKWIWVKYKGFLPDTFRIGADVIVEGTFKDKIFWATKLMTKCPSKYKSAD